MIDRFIVELQKLGLAGLPEAIGLCESLGRDAIAGGHRASDSQAHGHVDRLSRPESCKHTGVLDHKQTHTEKCMCTEIRHTFVCTHIILNFWFGLTRQRKQYTRRKNREKKECRGE